MRLSADSDAARTSVEASADGVMNSRHQALAAAHGATSPVTFSAGWHWAQFPKKRARSGLVRETAERHRLRPSGRRNLTITLLSWLIVYDIAVAGDV